MIRWATREDFETLGQVMFDAIHGGDSPYTAAQRQAWLPAPNRGAIWDARLARQRVAVAEQDGRAVGFMTLGKDGCIELAFLLPEARGRGLFSALFAQIEAEALARGQDRLWTNASLMAEGPFTAAGFVLESIEHVQHDGERLKRFRMLKWLQDDQASSSASQ